MGKPQRDKGKRGERECVKALQAMGMNATRTALLQSDKNIGAPDVMADYLHVASEPFPVEKIAFDIECKVGKQVGTTIYKWWLQACEAKHIGDAMPLLYIRRDNEKALVVMDLETFERILKA